MYQRMRSKGAYLAGSRLLGPTHLVNILKDNATRSSTLEVQIQLWDLNQNALCMRNISKMGS